MLNSSSLSLYLLLTSEYTDFKTCCYWKYVLRNTSSLMHSNSWAYLVQSCASLALLRNMGNQFLFPFQPRSWTYIQETLSSLYLQQNSRDLYICLQLPQRLWTHPIQVALSSAHYSDQEAVSRFIWMTSMWRMYTQEKPPVVNRTSSDFRRWTCVINCKRYEVIA